jgi:hypothetical protein
MTIYIVVVHLVVDADEANPRTGVAAQLDRLLSDTGSVALVDWAVAGVDLADSMAPVKLPADYRPGESAFPAWPCRPQRQSAAVAASTSWRCRPPSSRWRPRCRRSPFPPRPTGKPAGEGQTVGVLPRRGGGLRAGMSGAGGLTRRLVCRNPIRAGPAGGFAAV